MSSTVTCGYDGASWSANGSKDACDLYAEVMGVCSSQFTVGPVTPSSPPYQPATNECACNVVAYNLMAACAWCQSAIQTDWWLTEDQWRGNCTAGSSSSTTYNAVTLPATVAVRVGDDIPLWAFAPVVGNTWNPALASALAVGGASETGTATNTRTTNLGAFTNVNTNTRFGGFSTTSTPRYTGYPYSGFDDGLVKATVSGAAIALGLIFGLWALVWIIAGVVYFVRQKRRKAWYGPMAAYYAAGGAGGHGGLPYAGGAPPYNPSNTPYQPPYGGQQPYASPYDNNSQRHLSMAPGAAVGAPLLFNNEPNAMGSPHMTHSSLPPSSYGPTSSPSPGPNTNPYGGVDMHHSVTTTAVPPGTNPFNTPYPTPSNEQPYGGPPSALGGPGNTNSMYGAPSGPPPHGGVGYKGHAEVY